MKEELKIISTKRNKFSEQEVLDFVDARFIERSWFRDGNGDVSLEKVKKQEGVLRKMMITEERAVNERQKNPSYLIKEALKRGILN